MGANAEHQVPASVAGDQGSALAASGTTDGGESKSRTKKYIESVIIL